MRKVLESRRFETPVLIFGGDSVNALGISKNLGRLGIDVYYVSEMMDEVAYSRYCKKSFVVPGIQSDAVKQRAFLAEFGEKWSSAVVFPGSDLACLGLAALKGSVGSGFRFCLANEEVVEELVDKKKFYRSLESRGIDCPGTYFLEDVDDVKQIAERVRYPVFVKPAISQIFFAKFHKKGFVASSEKELVSFCRLLSGLNISFMVQEIIPGPAGNIFGVNGFFDKSSNPVGLFCYRRIRQWPHGFGNNTLIESVHLDSVPSIVKTTVDYLRNIGYYGLFDAEFKLDERDSSFKFIEVNARSWWQNFFPANCGVNLVFMAYLDAINEKVVLSSDYRSGLKWQYFVNDTVSVIRLFQKKELSFGEWRASLKNINTWGYFSVDDPLPSVLNVIFTFSRQLGLIN